MINSLIGGFALDNDRQKALDTVIKNMEKSFGKGAVMKLGDNKDAVFQVFQVVQLH